MDKQASGDMVGVDVLETKRVIFIVEIIHTDAIPRLKVLFPVVVNVSDRNLMLNQQM